ncbi:hypothetical protein [Tsuneonella sp. HG222]
MSVHFPQVADQAAAAGTVTAADILALRREGRGDEQIELAEAEAILALDAAPGRRPAEWREFMIREIARFVLTGWEPRDYVTEEQGEWLAARIAPGGRVASPDGLELLVRVCERAHNVPELPKRVVLAEIDRAAATGEGPTRAGGAPGAGVVTDTECTVLRRTLFAAGGERTVAVSREEAELLFRLKDLTPGTAENSPAWPRLFVEGVGNYLQGYAALSAQLSPERAAQLAAAMNDTATRVGRFIGRMAQGADGGLASEPDGSDELERALLANLAADGICPPVRT